MNSPLPAPMPVRRNWTRRLVNLLVALVVIAVAAAAFVFSYDGVHAIALFGGVSEQLARYYPGLFDAVLVIACVAAVMLRDGQWWARLWAWVVIIVLLAAIGTTDVLHAMNYTLRHRLTEGIVAAAPVVAVLLAFSLLLTLLRQSRTPAEKQTVPAPLDVPALPAAVSAPPIALPAASATAPTEAMRAAEDWTVPEWTVPVNTGPDRTGPGAAPTREVPAGAAPVPPPPIGPPVEVRTGPTDSLVTNAAPARAGQVRPASQDAVPASPPEVAHPATRSNKAIVVAGAPVEVRPSDAGDAGGPGRPAAEAARQQEPPAKMPTAEASSALDKPAPPTVQVPALPTVQVPALSPEPASEKTVPLRRPHGIRYAGNGVPGMAGNRQAAEGGAPGEDYWDTEEAGQFAGLVYPARENEPDAGDEAIDALDGSDADDDVDDLETDEPAGPKSLPELDDDAPPFATAPFASVPRLNRVRSTPTPPADEDKPSGD
jgi:hypothetical protein